MKHHTSAWILLAALIWGSFGGALLSLLPRRNAASPSGLPCCAGRVCTMHAVPVTMPASCNMASGSASPRTSCTCSISQNDPPQLASAFIELRFDLARASVAPALTWPPIGPDAHAAAALSGYAPAPDQPPETVLPI